MSFPYLQGTRRDLGLHLAPHSLIKEAGFDPRYNPEYQASG